MPAAGKAGPNLMFSAKDPGHPIRQVQIKFSNQCYIFCNLWLPRGSFLQKNNFFALFLLNPQPRGSGRGF
jgi:hypothetical protein